jgi:hypothetical protein
MATSLSELFQASGGKPIQWEDQLVHMMFEFADLDAGKELRIDFSQPNPARPEALRLKSRGGSLELNGKLLDDVVLWSDSAPHSVFAGLHPKRAGQPMSVRVWNAWRDELGTMQAWIGNSGMLIEELRDHVTMLRCSDGFDDPSFDDLVARVEVVNGRPST